jgi:hypothetical protein
MFRTVPNGLYAGITAEIMLDDIIAFNNSLTKTNSIANATYEACYMEDRSMMHSLMEEQQISFFNSDVENLRLEIKHANQR